MIDALADFGCYPHKDDLYLFVRRYDGDSDGRVLFSDFCQAFTPKDTLAASILTKRPAVNCSRGLPRISYFSKETRDAVIDLFRKHFTSEETAELLRQRMARRPHFSAHDAFSTIDATNTGYLTSNDMHRILMDHKVYRTNRDVHLLFDRYDRNKDGRISYEEFMDEMQPKFGSGR
jgi:hypothetical protein